MDNDLITTEEAFEAIPPEVQQYIYSDEFDQKMSELFSSVTISDEKKEVLKGSLFNFIAQIEDEDDVVEAINQTTSDENNRMKIKNWIEMNISQKILSLITEAYALEDEDEEINDQVQENSTETNPTSLSTLTDRLKRASIATPKKIEEGTISKTVSAKATIDPYHESIDN